MWLNLDELQRDRVITAWEATALRQWLDSPTPEVLPKECPLSEILNRIRLHQWTPDRAH
jgi:hypothetical protein